MRPRPARRLARDLPERFYRPLTYTRLLSRLRKEIAILKKLRHEHVVRLREVIDAPSSKYIFLGELRIVMRRLSWLRLTCCTPLHSVFEYMEGGEVKWRTSDERPILTVDQTRRTFRDIVLGLEYRALRSLIHHADILN